MVSSYANRAPLGNPADWQGGQTAASLLTVLRIPVPPDAPLRVKSPLQAEGVEPFPLKLKAQQEKNRAATEMDAVSAPGTAAAAALRAFPATLPFPAVKPVRQPACTPQRPDAEGATPPGIRTQWMGRGKAAPLLEPSAFNPSADGSPAANSPVAAGIGKPEPSAGKGHKSDGFDKAADRRGNSSSGRPASAAAAGSVTVEAEARAAKQAASARSRDQVWIPVAAQGYKVFVKIGRDATRAGAGRVRTPGGAPEPASEGSRAAGKRTQSKGSSGGKSRGAPAQETASGQPKDNVKPDGPAQTRGGELHTAISAAGQDSPPAQMAGAKQAVPTPFRAQHQPPPPIDPGKLVNAVRMTLTDGGGEVVLRLKPELLGRALITLHQEEDSLHVRFSLERPEARQVIEAEAARLKDALVAAGFQEVIFEFRASDEAAGWAERAHDDPRGRQDPRREGDSSGEQPQQRREPRPLMLGYNTFDIAA